MRASAITSNEPVILFRPAYDLWIGLKWLLMAGEIRFIVG